MAYKTVNFNAKLGRVVNALQGQTIGYDIARIAKKGMDKYTPVDTGRMRNTASVEPWKVTYGVPYAYYPYSGKHGNIKTEKNPNATAKWPEVWYQTSGEDFARAVQAVASEVVRRVQ